MAIEKILEESAYRVNLPDYFAVAYSDGVDGWIFWGSWIPLTEKASKLREELSKTKYRGQGIKPPRPGLTPVLIGGVWYWQEKE